MNLVLVLQEEVFKNVLKECEVIGILKIDPF